MTVAVEKDLVRALFGQNIDMRAKFDEGGLCHGLAEPRALAEEEPQGYRRVTKQRTTSQ